jgi:hypothetical protein
VDQAVLDANDPGSGMDPEIRGVFMPDLPLRKIRHPTSEDFEMVTL